MSERSENLRTFMDLTLAKMFQNYDKLPQAIETEERYLERMASYGIPPEHRKARIADFANCSAYEFPEWSWQRPHLGESHSSFLVGMNGTGKSYLAAAICGEWRGRWVSVRELVLRIRSTYRFESEVSELEVLHDMERPKVLVLDDLTAARMTDHGLAVVLGVISARSEQLKHTIVTSHHSLVDIDKMDTALASRLSAFAQFRFRGRDRRLSK